MNNAAPVRRRVLIALSALPAACAAPGVSIAPPSLAPGAPAVRAGDEWRYVETNGYNNEVIGESTHRVVNLSGPLRVQVRFPQTSSAPDEIYARPWEELVDSTFDMQQYFAAAVPLLPVTLAPGPTRRVDTTYRVSGRAENFAWQMEIRATDWQRITVPAGSFDTLHVVRRLWFDHPDSFRQGSTRTDQLWYSPLVNRWVRRETTGTYMLMNYSEPKRGFDPWAISTLREYVPARA